MLVNPATVLSTLVKSVENEERVRTLRDTSKVTTLLEKHSAKYVERLQAQDIHLEGSLVWWAVEDASREDME